VKAELKLLTSHLLESRVRLISVETVNTQTMAENPFSTMRIDNDYQSTYPMARWCSFWASYWRSETLPSSTAIHILICNLLLGWRNGRTWAYILLQDFGSLVCDKIRSNFRYPINEQLAEGLKPQLEQAAVCLLLWFPPGIVRNSLVTLKREIFKPRLYNRRSAVTYLDWSSIVLRMEG